MDKIFILTFFIFLSLFTISVRSDGVSNEILTGLINVYKNSMANSIIIFNNFCTFTIDMNIFLKQVHESMLKTCLFDNFDSYFQYIEDCNKNSMETISVFLGPPWKIIDKIRGRGLAHRLSLFTFFWNSKNIQMRCNVTLFEEPLRVILITQQRENVLYIYYNQATPDGSGHFSIVNSYDCKAGSLLKMPLIPNAKSVYKDFQERILYVPVIHSPPWHFVGYNKEMKIGAHRNNENSNRVIGGRDFYLLKLLANKMNFKFEYLDPPERTQGATITDDIDNVTFTGALGMLQRREADILLGDVAITYERNKAAEFSFFTLADSGAFATHAPRRLNEALALIRPFRWEVWPLLLFTIAISGPVLYFIIYLSSLFDSDSVIYWIRLNFFRKYLMWKKQHKTNSKKTINGFLEPVYLKEMSYGIKNIQKFNNSKRNKTAWKAPTNLLGACIWYAVTLFLKQSCIQLHTGYRTKFVTTILWLAVTYVIADVYSAQLTSQLARPARETPINTLHKLEAAMKNNDYQLFVERQSSTLNTLENGTEVFKRLFKLMKHQNGMQNGKESYLVSTVEEGISLILNGAHRAILGGRETLFFNMKRYGIQNFQISEKLYTRYSAVALQIGCPFKESLNKVLIHLFEGGILDKMTQAEYENMLKFNVTDNEEGIIKNDFAHKSHSLIEPKSQPVNLRMLQGAFIALGTGYFLASTSMDY